MVSFLLNFSHYFQAFWHIIQVCFRIYNIQNAMEFICWIRSCLRLQKKIECNNCILMMHTKTNDITLSLVADTLQEKHKLSKMKVYNENITRNHIIYKI